MGFSVESFSGACCRRGCCCRGFMPSHATFKRGGCSVGECVLEDAASAVSVHFISIEFWLRGCTEHAASIKHAAFAGIVLSDFYRMQTSLLEGRSASTHVVSCLSQLGGDTVADVAQHYRSSSVQQTLNQAATDAATGKVPSGRLSRLTASSLKFA